MLNANNNPDSIKSPESNSQPNPPTLRKITLNQRILQKNMNRISNNNVEEQPAPTTGGAIRHKKF